MRRNLSVLGFDEAANVTCSVVPIRQLRHVFPTACLDAGDNTFVERLPGEPYQEIGFGP